MSDYKFRLGLALAREEKLREELESALAREAEVGRLYDSLVHRSNRERVASYKREAVLRNDVLTLEKGGQLIVRDMHEYRQRLAVAEQRVDCLEELLNDAVSAMKMVSENSDDIDSVGICMEYVGRINEVFKPAAEGEGS